MLSTVAACVALAQSSARPTPVEVVSPRPPAFVTIDGRQVLIYELHITNFGPSSLRLTDIQVFGSSVSGSDDGVLLAAYRESELAGVIRPVADPIPGDPLRLDVGRRVIAFMYLVLRQGSRPARLRHRFLFDVADPSRSAGTANDETALDGIRVPVLPDPPIALAPPFKEGIWVASNGASNDSVHRRSVIALAGRPYIAQRFAIDWVMVGNNGDSFHDGRDRNENFWAFGQPVLAVADGEVIESTDGLPDNTPGVLPPVTVQNIFGNHVVLRLRSNVYVTYGHLKRGSIAVKSHQQIARGAQIAEVGNSGNTTAAHLHFQVTDGPSPLASEGIPWTFDRFTLLGLGKTFELSHYTRTPRVRELPPDDAVLTFR